jgi:sulfotransferase
MIDLAKKTNFVYTEHMKKTYHFMAGLPRSGSTVLSAILNQSPEVYSSPQTDLLGLLYELESKIPNYESYKAGLLFSSYDTAIRSVPDNFYSKIDKPVVIDKNRGWGTPYNWNNLSPYLSEKGKVILTMRPILEVLASFVKVSKESEKVTNDLPFLNKDLWVSEYRDPIDAMVDSLMVPNGEIDRAIFSIYNLLKNHGDQVHVVWYNDLVESPQNTLNGIYDFLGLNRYEHNFNKIVEADKHDDLSGYGVVGLHDINKKLAASKTKPEDYLSDYIIKKYGNAIDFLMDLI